MTGYTAGAHQTCGPSSFQRTCELCQQRFTVVACQSGFWGPNCLNQCPGGASNPCNGNGTCSQGLGGNGSCACFPGVATGSACQYTRASTCSGHGTPLFDGSCACDTGFGGLSCNQCAPSFYGYPTCTFCNAASTCSGHGTCGAAGGCICSPAYTGQTCSSCAPNHFDYPTCRHCFAPDTCSSHGSCLATGFCSCDSPYLGAGCDQCDASHANYPECSTICGDVSDDGNVNGNDVLGFRASLADPVGAALTPGGQSKCQVIAPSPAPACDVLDLVVIRRSLQSPPLAPGRAPVCPAVAP
jgi:hypothetical protein